MDIYGHSLSVADKKHEQFRSEKYLCHLCYLCDNKKISVKLIIYQREIKTLLP